MKKQKRYLQNEKEVDLVTELFLLGLCSVAILFICSCSGCRSATPIEMADYVEAYELMETK